MLINSTNSSANSSANCSSYREPNCTWSYPSPDSTNVCTDSCTHRSAHSYSNKHANKSSNSPDFGPNGHTDSLSHCAANNVVTSIHMLNRVVSVRLRTADTTNGRVSKSVQQY